MPLPTADRLFWVDAPQGIAAAPIRLLRWEHIAFGTANADQIFRFSLLDVEEFFIISDFVIFMLVERVRSLVRFVLAHAARLHPAYLA